MSEWSAGPAPTEPLGAPGRPARVRYRVDAARLWIGGLMAGLVAAGVAIVGLLVARGIFHVRVFTPTPKGELVNASTWWYALAAFWVAVAATGLLHLLLVAAPSPFRFFAWIVGLATAMAALVPFTTSANFPPKIASAAINVAIGIAVLSIVAGVGRSASQAIVEHSTVTEPR
jgi:Family of unknown function (DUF6069)